MVDQGKNTIDGKHYWAVYPCTNTDDGYSINPRYLWVIRRNEESNYQYQENIYDTEKKMFVLKDWYWSVGRGVIHNGEWIYVVNRDWTRNRARLSDGSLIHSEFTDIDSLIEKYGE